MYPLPSERQEGVHKGGKSGKRKRRFAGKGGLQARVEAVPHGEGGEIVVDSLTKWGVKAKTFQGGIQRLRSLNGTGLSLGARCIRCLAQRWCTRGGQSRFSQHSRTKKNCSKGWAPLRGSELWHFLRGGYVVRIRLTPSKNQLEGIASRGPKKLH